MQVRAGQSATVAPLTNDTSGGSEPLRLARVDEVRGAIVRADFAANTFTFASDAVGIYYVQYLAAVGIAECRRARARRRAAEATDSDLPPVAVRDVALLPSGGEVLVNVLVNDSDPGGGILVVQSVTVEPDSGISVAVLDHETLRISDQPPLGEQVRIGYRDLERHAGRRGRGRRHPRSGARRSCARRWPTTTRSSSAPATS